MTTCRLCVVMQLVVISLESPLASVGHLQRKGSDFR